MSEKEEKIYVKGKALASAIKRNNITQSDLCKMIGMSDDKLSLIIHKKRMISIDILEEICGLLNIDTEKLIDRPKTYYNRKQTSITGAIWNDDYFKKCLKSKNMTMKELGKTINRSEKLFWNYKAGRASVSLESLEGIVKALDCSTKKLVGVSEAELNKQIGRTVFECRENDISCTNTDGESIDNTDEDTDKLAVLERPVSRINDFKHFEGTNVLENINTMNENIYLCMEYMKELISEKNDYIYELRDLTFKLTDKINNLEEKISELQIKNAAVVNNQSKKTLKTAPIYTARYCSDKEFEQILHSTVTDDDLSTYKDKIYKLAGYKSKRMNIPVNNIMHDAYVQFTKIYGFNFSDLKAQTNQKETLDALYSNDLCREIFFNMMCKICSE